MGKGFGEWTSSGTPRFEVRVGVGGLLGLEGQWMFFLLGQFCLCFLKGWVWGGEQFYVWKFQKTKALPSTQVTAWRVLKNKLATKFNLVRRRVEYESILCILCGVEEESSRHLFFEYRLAWLVWSQCYAWLGAASVDHSDPYFHFLQFRMCKASETVNAVWETIWIAIVSEIWRHKNKLIFKGWVADV